MNFPYRKALVTGGAGFIGSHLVERLLQLGADVVSVDNYVAGRHENLAHLATFPGFSEIEADVLDEDRLRPLFSGVDVVFHAAASRATVSLRSPSLDLDTNAKGTFNVLDISRQAGVRKFVHLSTGSVYGEPVYSPQDEHHPLNPSTYYGVSKLAGEKYAMAFAGLHGMDVTVLRNYHVYGPRQDWGPSGAVVAIFMARALRGEPLTVFGDGAQLRSFTYVDDIVAANILVASRPESRGQIYNCASGIRVSIRELAERVAALSGMASPRIEKGAPTPGDVRGFAPDNTRIKQLGLTFTDFDDGLRVSLDWYLQHRSQL